jgi:enoyl-CoA hydratase/carnithine racemase
MSPFRASAPLTERWEHFSFEVADGVATLSFSRPEKLNALTFDAYADLRDLVAELPHHGDARVLVITGQGRGFCSGGDVEEIIGALQRMEAADLLEFARMTGAVVKGLRDCPLPVIAAVNGIAAGRGLGDRAGRRLPSAGPLGDVRLPVHARRALGCRHGLGLPAPALVGLGRATELLMLGEKVDASGRSPSGWPPRSSTTTRCPAPRRRWRDGWPTARPRLLADEAAAAREQ